MKEKIDAKIAKELSHYEDKFNLEDQVTICLINILNIEWADWLVKNKIPWDEASKAKDKVLKYLFED